ncbi:MAG: HD domain-containing protein [Dictyoglomaceae bacterium]|nr:HD domain-containing protein [Dictyoglomaceae bacterium]
MSYIELLLKIKNELDKEEDFKESIERINILLRENLGISIKLEVLENPICPKEDISDRNFYTVIQTIYSSFIFNAINKNKALDKEDIAFIKILALFIKEQIEKNERKTLRDFTFSLLSKRNINELFEEILKELEKIVPYTSASIGILEKDTLQYLCFRGFEKYSADKFMKSFKMERKKFHTLDTVLKTKNPLLIENTEDYPFWLHIPETSWIKSFLMIPIIYKDEITGIISFDSDKAYTFSKEDIEKVNSIIPILALSLENVKLYESLKKELEEKIIIGKKLQSSLYQVIKIASDLVETKDPYTAGHQKEVARISIIIGREMGLSQERLRFIAICALLHDLGKIAIPSEILNKPSILNPLERALVNTHPEIGYNILKKIDILGEVAPVVYQHHERWDGSGYPLNLKNNEILLEARIIAVADVAEAMTSHRPYRPALPFEFVLKELSEKKGILYDPSIVDTFLEAYKKGKLRYLNKKF